MHRHASAAIIVGGLILAVQIGIGYLAYVMLPDWPTRGQFGDVFGAANALFSGLAFAGLIYTVLLQREELALQRKELELTREELSRAASAQEQSEMALRSQAAAAERSAKMTTVSVLLEHYRSELRTLRSVNVPGDDRRQVLSRTLLQREAALLRILNEMYSDVTGEGGGDGSAV